MILPSTVGAAKRTGEETGGASQRRRLAVYATLALIVVVGAFIRWDRLQYAEFNYDQALVLNLAYNFVHEGAFPLVGATSSVGSAQGPVEIYLLSLPLLFSDNPMISTAFVGLLQMLAVVGTYIFTARYFGRPAGLIAAAMFAANPYAIHHARKIWTPEYMPLFTLLFFAALYAAVVRRWPYGVALACPLLAVLYLTHASGIFLAPLLLLVVVMFWRRIGLRPLALGAALALVVALPYLWHESQQGFAGLGTLGNASVGTQSHFDLRSLSSVVELASAQGLSELANGGKNAVGGLASGLSWLSAALLFLGAGVAAWRTFTGWRARRSAQAAGSWEKYLLLLLWFAVPVLATVRHPADWYLHYFTVTYPLQFILIGVGLSSLPGLAQRLPFGTAVVRQGGMAAAVAALTVGLAVVNITAYSAYQSETQQEDPGEPYGVPLAYSEQAVQALREFTATHGDALVYVYCSFNQWPGLSYLARPDLTLNKVEPPEQVVLPKDGGNGVVFAIAANDAAAQPLSFTTTEDASPLVQGAHDLGFVDLPQLTVAGPSGFVYYRFLYLPPRVGAAVGPGYEQPEWQLGLRNGLDLAAYKVPETVRPGQEIDLSLVWSMPEAPEQYPWIEYNLFAHVVDRAGNTLAQQDWEMFQYRTLWRANEYLVADYRLTVPAGLSPGLVWLNVGAYDRFGRQPAPWTNAAGQPQGEAYKIGPIKIAPPTEVTAPPRNVGAVFGDAMELAGYSLDNANPAAGDTVVVTLHWQALAKPREDYVVSVQLLDAEGQLVAQHDAPPVAGNYPTSYWEAGEQIADAHPLAIPTSAKPGTYRLVALVYSAQSRARLATTGGDSVELAPLVVRGR
ncbi:MAG: ArnT family glycosyltransferase [Chloroflexota bacterium]